MDNSTSPEHTVPEVSNIQIKLEPREADLQAQVQMQHDDTDTAAADAAKDLFGNDLFHDVHAEEFWNDLLSTNTSEPNLNFFDNVQHGNPVNNEISTVEIDSSLKFSTSQPYYQQGSQSQQTLVGI